MAKINNNDQVFNFSATALTGSTDAAVAAHSWTAAPTAANGNLDRQRTEVEYVNRENGGQTQYFAGVFQESLTFGVAMDPTDGFYSALETAYVNGTEIALAVTNGAIATTGTRGYAANFSILQFPLDLDQGNISEVEVTARPSSQINRLYTAP